MAAAEEVDTAGQGVVRTLKDLFAGAAGGVAQVLIGLSNFTSFDLLLPRIQARSDGKELGQQQMK
jgi:solute carrier family 25 carnitine/acylcarnitine transporter 20/29